MILALAVALGLVIALVRHGRKAFTHLASIPLRYAWLVLIAVVLQIPLLRSPAGPLNGFRLQQVLLLVSYLFLFVFLWNNRHIRTIWILGLGISLNLLVILANLGWMPITPQTLVRINPGSSLQDWREEQHYAYSKDLILARENTRLWILSDILVVPPPFPIPVAFSLGDLFIALGILWLMIQPYPTRIES